MAQLTRRPGAAHRLPHPARHRRRHLADGHLLGGAARRSGEPALAEGAHVVVHAQPEYYVDPRHAVPRGRPRSARSASASCWRGSSSSAGCWPPRDCSRPTASARCRSCPARRAGLRARVGGRAGRRGERPASLARGDASGSKRSPCRARPPSPRSSRRCSGSTRDPDGRRDRGDPRRRFAGGPAAVLRRGPGARGRRLPHAGGQRDRARARHPAARPGRRRARVDADRRRQAGGARRRRGARPGGAAASPRRAAVRALLDRETAAWTRCAAARCWPTRTTCWCRCGRRSPRCGTAPAGCCPRHSTGRRTTCRTPGRG